jgi:hypothetical protein
MCLLDYVTKGLCAYYVSKGYSGYYKNKRMFGTDISWAFEIEITFGNICALRPSYVSPSGYNWIPKKGARPRY